MQRFTLTALALASLFATACTKDKDPQPKTTEQLLTANTWRLTGITANPGLRTAAGHVITDIYPFVPSCTKDDTQQFVAGGQFRNDEGPSKCEANDDQTVTGTWAFAKSGTDNNVTIAIRSSTMHFKVLEVNDTQLKMVTNDDPYGLDTGTSVAYTLTYAKQ